MVQRAEIKKSNPLVFSIEEFALYDGPGIRTAVFFKGCPLRCNWCHNPEGFEAKVQLKRNQGGCLKCGKCKPLDEKEPSLITPSDLAVCPKSLLRISGKMYSASELAEVLSKNAEILVMNGGGITFSGGECLLHAEYVREVVQSLKTKLHIAIETCGCVPKENFIMGVELSDLVFFDLKIMDDQKAIKFTGRDTRQIKENFEYLKNSGKKFIVRVPLIPGVTDTKENYEAIVKAVKGSGAEYVELLPYNKMAGGKYAAFGLKYEPMFDERREPVINKAIFENNAIPVRVY